MKARWLVVIGVARAGSAHAQPAPESAPASAGTRDVRALELTPSFEASVGAAFQHAVGGGFALEAHLTGGWSVGVVGFAAASIDTGLDRDIIASLDDAVPVGDPTPTRAEWHDHLATMPLHGALYVGVTPWRGDLAPARRGWVHFDLHGGAGLALARMQNACCTFKVDPSPGGDLGHGLAADRDPNDDPAVNAGMRVGLYLGGGLHVFLGDAVAIDLTVRDYLFDDNPSGLDTNDDLMISSADDELLHHVFAGVGIATFLPLP